MTFKRPGGAQYSTPRGGKRVRDVLPAGAAIAGVLKLHGISDQVRAERLVTEWTELVGAKISQRTRPHGIFERTLVIEVATSAWMHELTMLKQRLLDGLRGRLGDPPLFDELRFRLAGSNRKPPTLVPSPRRRQPPPIPQGPPATGKDRDQIEQEVEVVADDDLRALIARVRIRNNR